MKLFYATSFVLMAVLLSAQSPAIFTSSGNFVVPLGITSLTIEVVGAGGNGAGNGGGGGGGGGYAKGVYAVTPNTNLNVTVGAAGGGTSGGTSSVANLISATGGSNGTTVNNPNVGGGGAGGTGANGTIANNSGGAGGGGFWTYFGGGGGGAAGPGGNGTNGGNTIVYTSGNCLTPGGSAGASGGAPGGNGGKGAGFTDNQCNTADPGAAGAQNGGGGGGGNGNGFPAMQGAGGYVKIEYAGCSAPAAPTNATGAMSICSGTTIVLSAGNAANVAWFATPSGGQPLGTGLNYTTAVLTTTTTFYAEAVTCTSSAVRTAFTVTVHPLPVITIVASPPPYCANTPFTLTASGAPSFIWSNAMTGHQLIYVPSGAIIYSPTAVGISFNNCIGTAQASISINPQPSVLITSSGSVCAGQVATFTASGAANYLWSAGAQTATFSTLLTNNPAVLTVTGTAPTGCSNTASIMPEVAANPTVVAVSSKTSICVGETINLNGAGADTYTWTGLGSTKDVSYRPLTSATYTLKGALINGCFATSTVQVFVIGCLNIALTENDGSNTFQVYPNPSKGDFLISTAADLTIGIYSVEGKLLKSYDLSEHNKHNITVSDLPAGTYIVRAPVSKDRSHKIIVVEK